MSITDLKSDRLSAIGLLQSRIASLLGVIEEAEKKLKRKKKIKLQILKDLPLSRSRTMDTSTTRASEAKVSEVRKNEFSAEKTKNESVR